jgi:hypothetical protein
MEDDRAAGRRWSLEHRQSIGAPAQADHRATAVEEDKRYLEIRVARLDTAMAGKRIPRRAPAT